jgi:phage terminase small subunit
MAGTYKECFDDVIGTLAGILEKRDLAQEMFDESGESIIVEHTNKGGATNLEQNPTIRLINDLNRDALSYWRELGLTPKSLRAINDEALKEKKVDALTEALLELESGNSD